MCEQCTFHAIPLGTAVPGWGLVRALRGTRTGQFGLVEMNDPTFWFPQVPEPDPIHDWPDDRINALASNSPEWRAAERWLRQGEAFSKTLKGSPEEGWRLFEACRKAGFKPRKHGHLAYWLFHRMAKLVQARRWLWPLPGLQQSVPRLSLAQPHHPNWAGAFGVERKHETHTGVDLYAPIGQSVVAVESGTVVKIERFTGPAAKSPWYLPTQAVLIAGRSGVVVYGEIRVSKGIKPGCKLRQGQQVGTVSPVLCKDKGNGVSMLHLEIYTEGNTTTVTWPLGELQPMSLSDPTPLLVGAKNRLRG